MINYVTSAKSLLLLLCMLSANLMAEDAALHKEIQTVKASVIELQKELYQLEQDLINPATIRAEFHFSLSYGEFFSPLSLSVKVDDVTQLQHIYTEREVKALELGAIQPLGGVNMPPGQHKLTAVLIGEDQYGQSVELVEEVQVNKTNKKLITEIQAVDFSDLQSARLKISHW